MISKIIKKAKVLSRICLRFDLPKKNKILLFDETHSTKFKNIIKINFNILHIRYKKIYFWIFLKQVIFFDFTFKTYCKNFIKFTSPKVIITFNDARFEMYELKKDFKNIYFISVMNGDRYDQWFKQKKKLWPNKLKCDYFFVLNKYYILKFKNLIDADYKLLGHFKNNSVNINKKKIFKQFLYISQVPAVKKEMIFYIKLCKFLKTYFSNLNKKIHILLRNSPRDQSIQREINFYKNIFQDNCILHQTDQWKKKYKLLDKFENILFATSTMGREAGVRKKKIACLAPPQAYGKKDHYFGWPGSYNPNKKKHNFFSVKSLTFNEVKRVLDNIKNCNQKNWNKKYYNEIKDQQFFDRNNMKLKNLLNKLLNS